MATCDFTRSETEVGPYLTYKRMQMIEDKSCVEYQRLTWGILRRSINSFVNLTIPMNIKNIIIRLIDANNLIRGKGFFCTSCIEKKLACPSFTHVYAALVCGINSKFPEVGELLLRRLVLQIRSAYHAPQLLLPSVKFLAHLVNQRMVAQDTIAFELVPFLLDFPTDHSVEAAVAFFTECGSLLQDVSPKSLDGAFERFDHILRQGQVDKRVQLLISGLFAIRKANFQGYPPILPELDLVQQEDRLTHRISLLEDIDPEIALDIFKPDDNFLENEKKYQELKNSIFGVLGSNGGFSSDDNDL